MTKYGLFFFIRINQLCELLSVKEDAAALIPSPVEPALEANEITLNTNGNNKRSKSKLEDNTQLNALPNAAAAATAEEVAPECIQAPRGTIPIQTNTVKSKKVDHDARIRREFVRKLKIECDNYGIDSNGTNRTALPHDQTNGARYEVPDIKLSQTAARILGNRKELEMHEFSAKSSPPPTSVGRKVDIPIVDPSGDRRQQ